MYRVLEGEEGVAGRDVLVEEELHHVEVMALDGGGDRVIQPPRLRLYGLIRWTRAVEELLDEFFDPF